MDANEVISHLRTMSIEQVVAWMVQNMGHAELRTCIRKVQQVPESNSKSSKSSDSMKGKGAKAKSSDSMKGKGAKAKSPVKKKKKNNLKCK